LECQAHLRLAERDTARAAEHLEMAGMADPLASEPWRQLAAIEFETWWQHPENRDDLDRFLRARNKALQLAPNASAIWLASGDWALRAFSLQKKTMRSSEIPDWYCRAVQLYPNNAIYRAKLAEAYRAAGESSAFRREAKTALWLDKVTPHVDKKLPADVRDRLLRSLAF